MSASLVGSEMCIRDRVCNTIGSMFRCGPCVWVVTCSSYAFGGLATKPCREGGWHQFIWAACECRFVNILWVG
eukprot:12585283-Alexandrium_andersonii.AAC.1